ncbi:microsomal signal peptidase 25 kDa subunit-domain-containing protein [Hygrophoropsis aurantiaca]|uniref:Microsomal signal peptidase 25 kDa subunit-domain-containing protein n=1 Tax=Hygrophoropsis aurantiaca TaxID=72124 RepID=A0ACB8AKM3_9AGAM|nr:microsomal signal peptidase 25 kDa subunit-domain-containing protein [Hygrophoropsis aurantiaca]
MARKTAKELSTPEASPSRRPSSSGSSPEKPPGPLSITTPPEDREVVKINTSNLVDLKNTCDDALKRYLSRPDLFKQIHLHTDVRLTLGWGGVFVAGATGLYGWKTEFEAAKPAVWAGLILYILLTTLQTLYAYFVEGDIIFVGRRKTFSKRIVTERITISSRTEPVQNTNPPAYELSISYVQSSGAGKSLLGKGKTKAGKEYNAFFDETGVMDQEKFELWVGGLVEEVMEGKAT